MLDPEYESKLEDAINAKDYNKLTNGLVLGAAGKSNDQYYLKGHGKKTTNDDSPSMDPDAVMTVYSCTKLITAIATLQCVENGLLDLDEDIARVLPQWKDPQILTGFEAEDVPGEKQPGAPILTPAQKKITPRLMLTHQAGMTYDILSPLLMAYHEYKGTKPDYVTGDVEKCFSLPLVFEPGSDWMYGCGLHWLGKAVEKVTNMRFGEWCSKQIFTPLEMNSTTFQLHQHPDLIARYVRLTARDPISGFLSTPDKEPEQFGYTTPSPDNPAPKPDDDGGGGLYTTPRDFLALLTSLLRNDSKILRPTTVNDYVFTPQMPESLLTGVFSQPWAEDVFVSGRKPNTTWNMTLAAAAQCKEDVPGRHRGGTIFWGGLPNTTWWIDQVGGTCGFVMMQLVPPDPKFIPYKDQWTEAVFREWGR